jgi:5-methylcytosine-specific restriction endonuclease McrBC GTP-binding regulatory subunit McrB
MSYQYNPITDKVESVLSDQDMYDFFAAQGFFFPKEVLSRYYLSLKTKPFVILSGISGTGKTKIAQLFADYMCQNESEKERRQRIAFVPVRPDWMDNKGLLGYYNILDETYHSTALLDLLLAASEEPAKPHFVILDEMNLAKVEHYFSDFLSILESRTPDNPDGEEITLHPRQHAESVNGRKISGTIHVPANVFFAGTVNVDESTYMFSPKVLDRANVIEFNEVDLAAYGGTGTVARDRFTLLNGKVGDRFFEPDGKQRFCSKEHYLALDEHARHYLEQLMDILKGHNLHFGYRVANELGRFVTLALEEVGSTCLDDAVDIQIMQKILPKLHGTRAKLEVPLQELLAFCHAPDVNFSDELLQSSLSGHPDILFPRAAQKIARMLGQLSVQGYASFVE